ncbi:MAG: 4-oxalocrotonate tautomerase family protein [Planctomycetota bacterium]
MPYINLKVTPAITVDQKREIVERFTRTLVDVLGKKPEQTHIVIDEIDEQNWGFAGMLTKEYRAQQTGG